MKPLTSRILDSLSILIPTYNDEKTIRSVVEESWQVARKISKRFEIVVINDASTDKTERILREIKGKLKELKIIFHRINQGYGRTIKELYYAGRYQWLFTLPGDGQIEAKELLKLISNIKYQILNDIIIGWRKNRQDPPERLRQSKIYNTLLNLLFGLNLHDVNSVRLMQRKILDKIKLSSVSAFVDAELAIKARSLDFKIIEVPIAHRVSQKVGGGGRWRTITPTIWEMIKYKINLL